MLDLWWERTISWHKTAQELPGQLEPVPEASHRQPISLFWVVQIFVLWELLELSSLPLPWSLRFRGLRSMLAVKILAIIGGVLYEAFTSRNYMENKYMLRSAMAGALVPVTVEV